MQDFRGIKPGPARIILFLFPAFRYGGKKIIRAFSFYSKVQETHKGMAV